MSQRSSILCNIRVLWRDIQAEVVGERHKILVGFFPLINCHVMGEEAAFVENPEASIQCHKLTRFYLPSGKEAILSWQEIEPDES